MAQAASITINDRATTPVAHVFAPRNVSTDLASFVEGGVVPIGERKLTISTKFSSGKYRSRIRIENPTLVTEVVNGVNVPKVPRTQYADVTFTFDATSTAQERKDTVAFLYGALASSQAMINASIVDLEGIW